MSSEHLIRERMSPEELGMKLRPLSLAASSGQFNLPFFHHLHSFKYCFYTLDLTKESATVRKLRYHSIVKNANKIPLPHLRFYPF